MFASVEKIISGCSCGHVHTLLTEECVVSVKAEEAMAGYLKEKGFQLPAIVCDENTLKFTERILAPLRDAGYDVVPVKTVAGNAHATEVFTAMVDAFLSECHPDVLIACGSGSVHDITRYCACSAKLPFVSYPTAASVDGFVSGVAAMTWYGQKLTFPSVPPTASFASPKVFCTAPSRLTASGVGDVFGKYTAVFDWKVAHILTGEYICEEICDLEKEAVADTLYALQNRSRIGEQAYTEKVMNALLLSGLAIQLTGNSRPASGSEHHMSHLWEMHRLNQTNDGLHGEQVGVGLLAVTRKYKAALRQGLDFDRMQKLDLSKVFDKKYLEPVFGDLMEGILKENLPKDTLTSSSLSSIRVTDPEAAMEAILAAEKEWLPDAEVIENILKMADAPLLPKDIGLDNDPAFLEKTLAFAPYARNRLTLLKILAAMEV